MLSRPSISLVPLSYLVAGISMFGPAFVSLIENEHRTSQVFFYSGLLVIVFALIAGFALRSAGNGQTPAGQLTGLVVIFVTLPAILAVPYYLAMGSDQYIDSYFDMISGLTTTGISAAPQVISGSAVEVAWNEMNVSKSHDVGQPYAIIYWRAQVAWTGGLVIWLAAVAILSPLGVGGFELVGQQRAATAVLSSYASVQSVSKKKNRRTWRLILCYVGLTVVLWILLIVAGDQPVSALISAMSTISTSGITVSGPFSPPSGTIPGELFICGFLVMALSRILVSALGWGSDIAPAQGDRELLLAGLLVLAAVIIAIFFKFEQFAGLRTWQELEALGKVIWGVVFSAVSFLSTTGFQSLHWEAGVEFQPDDFVLLSLLGMALIGGGVATTAGGVKLLRVDELLRFSSSELSRLAYPSTVLPNRNNSPVANSRERTVLACIFMMLILVLLAFFAATLSLSGSNFKEALVLSIASLTNTGPLTNAALGNEYVIADLSLLSKLLLCGAMIIGRLELLALITLLSPALLSQSLYREEVDKSVTLR